MGTGLGVPAVGQIYKNANVDPGLAGKNYGFGERQEVLQTICTESLLLKYLIYAI